MTVSLILQILCLVVRHWIRWIKLSMGQSIQLLSLLLNAVHILLNWQICNTQESSKESVSKEQPAYKELKQYQYRQKWSLNLSQCVVERYKNRHVRKNPKQTRVSIVYPRWKKMSNTSRGMLLHKRYAKELRKPTGWCYYLTAASVLITSKTGSTWGMKTGVYKDVVVWPKHTNTYIQNIIIPPNWEIGTILNPYFKHVRTITSGLHW